MYEMTKWAEPAKVTSMKGKSLNKLNFNKTIMMHE